MKGLVVIEIDTQAPFALAECHQIGTTFIPILDRSRVENNFAPSAGGARHQILAIKAATAPFSDAAKRAVINDVSLRIELEGGF